MLADFYNCQLFVIDSPPFGEIFEVGKSAIKFIIEFCLHLEGNIGRIVSVASFRVRGVLDVHFLVGREAIQDLFPSLLPRCLHSLLLGVVFEVNYAPFVELVDPGPEFVLPVGPARREKLGPFDV
jgi:hypothetical protein